MKKANSEVKKQLQNKVTELKQGFTKGKIVLGSAVIGTALVASGVTLHKLNPKDTNDETVNEIGYEDFNPYFNTKVKENNFVVLDVGNNEEKGVAFQNSKISYCNENDISVGIIISSNSEKENEIYDDVELAKEILSESTIDFPVYLDINKIMENDNLNVEMKTKLIKDFLEKCSSNNMYVGVYGTDTNLCRLKEYCGISEYDAYLVMDKETIEYDGSYHLIKDLEGKISSDIDLSSVIKKKKLNLASNFVSDGTYQISEGDTILDIAMQYGLSVNELLEFNDISKKDLAVGQKLRIPMVIERTVPLGNLQYEQVSKPLLGCDLNHHMVESKYDWDSLEKNFDFIILRSNDGTREDGHYANNAKECIERNIPFGIYCYNRVWKNTFDDLESFKLAQEEQANFTIERAKNKKITYPVYLDIESEQLGKTLLTKEYIEVMLEVWKSKMTEAGYTPGIYLNKSGYDFLCSELGRTLEDEFEIWIAGGPVYGTSMNYKDIEVPSGPTYNYNEKEYDTDMYQVSEAGMGAGAQNGSGHLDIDYSFVDYSKVTSLDIESEDFDDIEHAIKPIQAMRNEKENWKTARNLSILALVMTIAVAIKYKNNSKNKTKTRRRNFDRKVEANELEKTSLGIENLWINPDSLIQCKDAVLNKKQFQQILTSSEGEGMYGASTVGKSKDNQEDGYLMLCHPKNKDFKIMVVCDGVGGRSAGELASNEALAETIKWFESLPVEDYYSSPKNLSEKWNKKIIEIDESLKKYTDRRATTYIGAIILAEETLICNIGDSQLYLLSENKLHMTEPHNAAYLQYKKGKIEELEDVRFSNVSNRLLNCLGSETKASIQFQVASNEQIEKVVLCSDGISDCVSLEDIENIILTNNPDKIVQQLLKKSFEDSEIREELINDDDYFRIIPGGKDNATCIAYSYTKKKKIR